MQFFVIFHLVSFITLRAVLASLPLPNQMRLVTALVLKLGMRNIFFRCVDVPSICHFFMEGMPKSAFMHFWRIFLRKNHISAVYLTDKWGGSFREILATCFATFYCTLSWQKLSSRNFNGFSNKVELISKNSSSLAVL